MSFRNLLFYSAFFLFLLLFISSFSIKNSSDHSLEDRIISLTINPQKQEVKIYWKDAKGNKLKSIQQLKSFVENRGEVLQFAMNAGMYTEDNSPLGLYIEDYKTTHLINTKTGKGNFF